MHTAGTNIIGSNYIHKLFNVKDSKKTGAMVLNCILKIDAKEQTQTHVQLYVNVYLQ